MKDQLLTAIIWMIAAWHILGVFRDARNAKRNLHRLYQR